MSPEIAVLVVVTVLAIIVFTMHNSLVARKNAVENAFGAIDAMCKKRYDLIPNLVAAVKKYLEHESGTLERIATLRSQAASGSLTTDETVELNNEITRSLGRLMVTVEDYPELKASENFLQLQRALNEAEEQLSASRRAFNAAVTDYNNAVGMLPTSILAALMNYKRRRLFEATEAERENVDVGKLFGPSGG